jgi:hypothetical protein
MRQQSGLHKNHRQQDAVFIFLQHVSGAAKMARQQAQMASDGRSVQ